MSRPRKASDLKVSRLVAIHPLDDGRFAIWNSVFPRVTVVDAHVVGQLKAGDFSAEQWNPESLVNLMRARLIYRGDEDPYEAKFFASAERTLAELDQDAEEFYRGRLPYASLNLVNSGCNLGCNYCVSYFGDDARRDATRISERDKARQTAILGVVDQYVQRKIECGESVVRIGFNGGEILLRWDDVEVALQHVLDRYPGVQLLVSMNTNATLIDPKVAASMAKFGVKIAVSIDGYEKNHDDTRHYHGGGGSYNKVMEGIANYSGATGVALKGFQGTIQDIDNFDNESLFKMSASGFDRARLAPNVMDQPADRGAKAAHWEAQLVLDSMGRPVELSSTEFHNILFRLHSDKVGFRFNCGGLSGLKQRTLTFNIDSMQLSQMCSFVSPASTPSSTVQNDIYDIRLWHGTRAYIRQRLDTLKAECQGCSAFGVCQGGCVYNGLDLYNRRHDSACNYQRAMLRHVIDFDYSGHVRKHEEPFRFLNGSPEGGRGSLKPGKKVWALTSAEIAGAH